jgi:pyridoxal biosynthesis lyase PdxS
VVVAADSSYVAAAGIKTPIDAFIMAKLAANGVARAPATIRAI